MNVLLIDADRCGLDFAQRCVDAGHAVKWFRYSKKPIRDGEGFKGIEFVTKWRDHMKWAKQGLILTTANHKFLKELDAFREFGFPIFSPSFKSAQMEINRSAGMKLMEKVGANIPPFKTFNSLKEAEAHARKADKAYVFKTMGDEEDKSLSFVAKDPAELVGWLRRKQAQGLVLKGPCMLQEKVEMVAEVGAAGWMGRDGFLPGKWEISFEHKKLMPGEFGPNCFTPDAEVLTRQGWKVWPVVTMEDEICTLKEGRIEFEKPSQVVVGDFDGELVGWQSPMLDILVTPGHNMYVQDDHCRKEFWFEPAIKSYGKRRTVMRAGGEWRPGEINQEAAARAALIGAYIADGFCRERSIVFGNCPPHKVEWFKGFALRVGLEAHLYGRDLYVNSKALTDEMRPLGSAATKRVPRWIMDGTSDVARAFLEGYAAGDGTPRANSLTFCTISRGLADDVQELCLKVGWAASVNVRDQRDEPPHMVNGFACFNREIAYEVQVSRERSKAEISPDNRYCERYVGKVYCVTVSSHVIYVRRHGKPCWIGQTGEQGTCSQYVDELQPAELILKPLEEEFRKMGHTGDLAVNGGVAKDGKYYPYELTCRAGWPDWYIRTAMHKGDPAQWMRDACLGHDTLKVSRDVAIGVVCSQPQYPYDTSTPEMVEGNPISGLEGVWDDIHPVQVMVGKGETMKDGKVVDAPQFQTTGEYVLVATGLGKTIEDARKAVYGVIDEISLPNMIVRNDIGVKVQKQLPELQKLGYATQMRA